MRGFRRVTCHWGVMDPSREGLPHPLRWPHEGMEGEKEALGL